ncbi:hotdog fold thioesterase [Erythrobacter arachoides]|uniref:Hotdog fold thioesterase n=1 Tax=Aurantiacibacter arachoides TaxID=1850444 RepID=A0A845A209_9SPHN|nr:PaaI family thioesterase [Aurantiacibacter arachoides]MXO93482.1 hotdog fold thioesterase [Aurantiacibacter arachoides]GGD49048.1 hypothetical protein GCM10011411_06000 [Aurantiacibacter arachoides]
MASDAPDGLALMQMMARGDIPPPSISQTMGMAPSSVERGRVVFESTADDRHLNPLGGVHGGFAATVLDSVTGCAVHTMLEAGVGYGTIDLQVKFLRPVPTGETLLAEGTVVHVSRNLATADGKLTTRDGKLLATATATCFIKRG